MTEPPLRLLSPAKLNLFLHITGRRADGYHELQTLFQLLNIGDEMSFSLPDNGAITLTTNGLNIPNQNNLIFRAAALLKHHTQSALGARIHIDKILPQGGGLGGGSSNAATTLLALNRLWNSKLGLKELAKLGLQLGADVPVFVHGFTAWAEGVGEKLQTLESKANSVECWYLIVRPNCEVSTGQIFSHQQLTRNTSPITIAAFFEQGGHNDCEPIVRRLYPQVEAALNWLSNYSPAQLTGTGACVFAGFLAEQEAKQVLRELPVDMKAYIAKGIAVSPVHSALGHTFL